MSRRKKTNKKPSEQLLDPKRTLIRKLALDAMTVRHDPAGLEDVLSSAVQRMPVDTYLQILEMMLTHGPDRLIDELFAKAVSTLQETWDDLDAEDAKRKERAA